MLDDGPLEQALPKSIRYQNDSRCFVFVLKTSYYAFRILPGGEVLHVGFGPLPDFATATDRATFSFAGLDNYKEANYIWDNQAARWELPTFGDVAYHDVAVKASFDSPYGATQPIRDLRLRYVSHAIRTDSVPGMTPAEHQPVENGSRETLCLTLRDISFDFDVTLYYRVTPEHDIIERWTELTNRMKSSVTIESLAFATVNVPNGRYELTRFEGVWAREFNRRRQTLEAGRTILESHGLNTGHATNPGFLMSELGESTENAGAVYFGALAYSGNWNLRFEMLPTGPVRVHGGYDIADFSLTIAPGGLHTTPAFVFGCANDGQGGASRRMHNFIRNRVLPSPRHSLYRPVLYNSWEAVYFKMSSVSQKELARKAATIGIELFCVDDGWFGGRRNDDAGLGDWTVSDDVFPEGLNELVDEVQSLGMRFGLWVEPEMVNPNSDLYRAHPEWVLNFEGRPRTESRQQLILDFGRPEVVETIWSALDTLLREHAITFLKWDMNRYATEPGSVVGKEIWFRHVEGIYQILDRLRADHPLLEIESCSGGGGRVDIGVLARTEQVWPSDNTNAYDRIKIQDGFSLIYPARVMECWVTHSTNHQTNQSSSLDFRFDVAMRGALGIGTSLNELSDDELAEYVKKIAYYKKLRPVVQDGDLYRLVVEPTRSIWLFVSADKKQAVYSAVVVGQPLGLHQAPIKLPGLLSHANYAAIDDRGDRLGNWTGFQLATLGLPSDTFGGDPATRSRTLLFELALPE